MDFVETTLNSKKIFTGKILSLRVDEVKLPNGNISKREIVEHPGAVAIVAINENMEVLMVKQYRKPTESTLLEIPAGKLEKGETADICAQRELMEEVGFRALDMKFLAKFYTTPGFSNELLYLFLGQKLEKKSKKADDDENIQVEKIPFLEAVKMAYDGKFLDAKTIIGLTLAYHQIKEKI
ncbi:MAG TPA: NUDIX hydrolase [Thermoanaerobacterales bacterium]|nr:NUDIX hydrolase [Thermoanaerobacterales bacterium]